MSWSDKIRKMLYYKRERKQEGYAVGKCAVEEVKHRKIRQDDLLDLFDLHNIEYNVGRNGRNLTFPALNIRIGQSSNKGRYVVQGLKSKGQIRKSYCTCYYNECFDVIQYYKYLCKELENEELIINALKLQFNRNLKEGIISSSGCKNYYRNLRPVMLEDNIEEMDNKFKERLDLFFKLLIDNTEKTKSNDNDICNSWACLDWNDEGYLLCKGKKSKIRPSYLTTIQTLHIDTDSKFGFTERVMQQLEMFDSNFKDYDVIDFLCSHYYDVEFEQLRQDGLRIMRG